MVREIYLLASLIFSSISSGFSGRLNQGVLILNCSNNKPNLIGGLFTGKLLFILFEKYLLTCQLFFLIKYMHNITFFFTAIKDDFTKMKYSFYNILYGSSLTTCGFETIVLCEFTSLYGYINKWRWRAAKLSAYISWHLRLGFTGMFINSWDKGLYFFNVI